MRIRSSPPTLTVDTSVVIDALDASRPAAIELFTLARRGVVDLAFSTRLAAELVAHSLDDVRVLLGGAELQILGTTGRWGLSTWDGPDTWASGEEVTVSAGAMDSDHLEAHRRAGRNFFITSDGPLTKQAARLGIAVLSPEQAVERFEGA